MRVAEYDVEAAQGSDALPHDRVALLVRAGDHLLGEEWFDWRRARDDEPLAALAVRFGDRLMARTIVRTSDDGAAPTLRVSLVVVTAGDGRALETTLDAVRRLDPAPLDTTVVDGAWSWTSIGAGEVVSVLRAGTLPLPGHVAALRRAFRRRGVGAALGPVLASDLSRSCQRARARQRADAGMGFQRRLLHRDASLPRPELLATTASGHVAVRRDVVGSLPLVEELETTASPAEVVAALLARGGVVVHEPDLAVRASTERRWRSALAGAAADGEQAVALMRRHPAAFRGSDRRWRLRRTRAAARAARRGEIGVAVLEAAAVLGSRP